jgi:phage protein D
MTPDYRITVNGRNITPTLNGLLISLTLTDERSEKADQLDITLDDSDGKLALPPRGAIVEVWLGFKDDLVKKGTFTVDEITHSGPPDRVVIRARSADFKKVLKTKREQSWHNIGLGDMLTTLAKRNALIPAIHHTLAGERVEHIDQANESDINLINRLGRHYDAVANIKAGRLLFTPAGSADTASAKNIPPVIITRNQGDTHNYAIVDRQNDYTGVQANWNEKAHGTLQKEIAGEPGNVKVIRHTHRSAHEAQKAATNEWAKMTRAGATFSLTLAVGDARLYPETPITAIGFKKEIDNTEWLLVRLVHSMGDSGFMTELECELATEE